MSNALSQYREKHGLTLAQLAEQFGVQAPALYKWETKRVPAERVLDVVRLTGIPAHELRPDLYLPATEAAQ
jgi:transcriptional regulator with XRE-family HTH domain